MVKPKTINLIFATALAVLVCCGCSKSGSNDSSTPPAGSDQYITWNIGGLRGYVATPPDSLFAYVQNGSSLFYANANASDPVYSYYFATFDAMDTGTFTLNTLDITTNGKQYAATVPATIKVDVFGSTGDYISGSYYGQLKAVSSDTIVEVTGEFKLRRQ